MSSESPSSVQKSRGKSWADDVIENAKEMTSGSKKKRETLGRKTQKMSIMSPVDLIDEGEPMMTIDIEDVQEADPDVEKMLERIPGYQDTGSDVNEIYAGPTISATVSESDLKIRKSGLGDSEINRLVDRVYIKFERLLLNKDIIIPIPKDLDVANDIANLDSRVTSLVDNQLKENNELKNKIKNLEDRLVIYDTKFNELRKIVEDSMNAMTANLQQSNVYLEKLRDLLHDKGDDVKSVTSQISHTRNTLVNVPALPAPVAMKTSTSTNSVAPMFVPAKKRL